MSGAIILAKVQNFVNQLNRGIGARVDYKTINDYAGRCANMFRRTLNPDNVERTFRLRMSNLGRPTCVLQADKYNLPKDPEPYSSRLRNMYGDTIEAQAVAIMRQSGVNIVKEQLSVSLEVAGEMIDGTLDLTIAEPDEKVYDIKTASGYAFRHKFSDVNLEGIWNNDDSFGYIVQLYCYSEAVGVPVGGLIVINKEDGQWLVVEPPVDDAPLRKKALAYAAANVRKLTSDAPFEKSFQPIPEKFKKKLTGNTILPIACVFCSRREHCWPTAQYLPQPSSKGQSPRHFWYVDMKENNNE